MIGPNLPPHLLENRSTTPVEEEPEAGPSQPPVVTVGPTIPLELLAQKALPEEEDEDDEDDYMPALPPDLASGSKPQLSANARKVQGPAFPPSVARGAYEDDESDDDVGPMPMPAEAEGHVAKKKRKGT